MKFLKIEDLEKMLTKKQLKESRKNYKKFYLDRKYDFNINEIEVTEDGEQYLKFVDLKDFD